MGTRIAKAALAATLIALLPACGWTPNAPSPGPTPIWSDGATSGYIELADRLRRQGLRVRRDGWLRQPFFAPRAQVMWVESAAVQVFEYPDPASRAEDSATIAADGMRIGSRQVDWVDPPHFWAKGTRIVLYTGTDRDLVDAITRALDSRPAAGPSRTARRDR